jgi:disulfide bond formation protein DsbB
MTGSIVAPTASFSLVGRHPSRAAALIVGIVALAVIISALILQYGFGYAPCPLCLKQRWPYYIGIPLALVLAAVSGSLPRSVRILWLVSLAALFVYGGALGVYHAGAEWHFWLEGSSCSADNITGHSLNAKDLLAALNSAPVVSCTDPRLRVFGISLAGWNVVVMTLLVIILLVGIKRESEELLKGEKHRAETGRNVHD